jgi:hypothetical protein
MSDDYRNLGGSHNMRPKTSDAPPSTKASLVDDESREALGLAAALAERIKFRRRTLETTRRVIDQYRSIPMAKDEAMMTPQDESNLHDRIERRVIPLLRAAEPDSAIKTLITSLDELVGNRTKELKDQLQISNSKITDLHRLVGELTVNNGELNRKVGGVEASLSESQRLLSQSEEARLRAVTERNAANENIAAIEADAVTFKAAAARQMAELRENGDEEKASLKKAFELQIANESQSASKKIKALEDKVFESDNAIVDLKARLRVSQRWQIFWGVITALVTAALIIVAI